MKKKMINAVASSYSEPSKENENNTSVDAETNVETNVMTGAAVVVVVVENAEPPVVEKKKRGRKN